VTFSESERNFSKKRLRALSLAASDMEQCQSATEALEGTTNKALTQALETAIAVCYARPFTQSSLYRLDKTEFRPAESRLAELHDTLLKLRDLGMPTQTRTVAETRSSSSKLRSNFPAECSFFATMNGTRCRASLCRS